MYLVNFALVLPLIFLGTFISFLTAALFKPKHQKDRCFSKELPSMTVIVPFRNEEPNLDAFLSSLLIQNYEGCWNAVLVNDRSTDNSVAVIKKFMSTHSRAPFLVVDSAYDASIRLTGKQQALETAISHATHDWLAFTDADVHLSPEWLSTFSTRIRSGARFIYGHTAISASKKNLFASFQSFQLRFLFCTAYAFSHAGITGSCMGNNICMSKKLYHMTGGQPGLGYSIVEDRRLMQRVCTLGVEAVPTEPFLPTVYTHPEPTVGSFYEQARRWAVGGMKGSKLLVAVMSALALQNALFLAALTGFGTIPVVYLSIINAVLLWLFTLFSFSKTGTIGQALIFPLYYCIMVLESIVLGIGTLFQRKIRWKGEKLQSA